MPKKMRFVSALKLYKLVPYRMFKDVEKIIEYVFGGMTVQRIDMYKKYLSVNNPKYLRWALETMVNWQPSITKHSPIHIHGKKDTVFPIKHLIGDVIAVDKGTHVMIITCYKWLNEYLPKILSEGKEIH